MNRKYELFEARVERSLQLSDKLYLISFKRNFNFIAGQVIALGVNREQIRYYSIASGETDEIVDILYDIKPSGYLTPRLALLNSGDTIFYSLPFGSFTAQIGKALWVATGTGIAPFSSMIQSGITENIALIHGAASFNELYFYDSFTDKLGKNYHICLTRESHPKAYAGRVTELLKSFPLPDKDTFIYFCGSAEMVVDARELLIGRGFPFSNIKAEIYF